MKIQYILNAKVLAVLPASDKSKDKDLFPYKLVLEDSTLRGGTEVPSSLDVKSTFKPNVGEVISAEANILSYRDDSGAAKLSIKLTKNLTAKK